MQLDASVLGTIVGTSISTIIIIFRKINNSDAQLAEQIKAEVSNQLFPILKNQSEVKIAFQGLEKKLEELHIVQTGNAIALSDLAKELRSTLENTQATIERLAKGVNNSGPNTDEKADPTSGKQAWKSEVTVIPGEGDPKSKR